MTMKNLPRAFRNLCVNAGFGDRWTTYELRHSFVSLLADQLDDLTKVADLAGHTDPRTTQGYRQPAPPASATPGTRSSSRARRAGELIGDVGAQRARTGALLSGVGSRGPMVWLAPSGPGLCVDAGFYAESSRPSAEIANDEPTARMGGPENCW